MKKTILHLLPAILCLCVIMISCDAQSDTLRLKADWIEQMKNDPIFDELQEAHILRQDLIMSDQVDIQAAGHVLKSSQNQNPCAITEDISNVKGGEEYFSYLCRYSNARAALNEKYPELASLTSEERSDLLYPSRSLTREDVLQMRNEVPD